MKFGNETVQKVAAASDDKTIEKSPANDAPNSTQCLVQYQDPIKTRPLFQALKGYSLFKQDVKLHAIVDFLNLSSHTSLLLCQENDIVSKLHTIVESPKMILKSMKGSCKFPAAWTSSFSAKFIIEIVELLENDRRLYESKSIRKNTRKSLQSALPPPAAKLVKMVESARVKVQSEGMSGVLNAARVTKRKSSKFKSVNDLLMKGAPTYNENFVEVTEEKIEDHLHCPLCNHRSLVSITTKDQADAENDRIEKAFDRKVAEWNRNGRVARKPRMEKTHSQILGCVCYMQNCIGNSDGSGCFLCKRNKGSKEWRSDER